MTAFSAECAAGLAGSSTVEPHSRAVLASVPERIPYDDIFFFLATAGWCLLSYQEGLT